MKKNRPVTFQTINYVAYEESYCHRLEPKLKQICYLAFHVPSVDARALKEKIYNIVEGATITDKFAWFLNQIREINDKRELYLLCRNSVHKARETIVERPVYKI